MLAEMNDERFKLGHVSKGMEIYNSEEFKWLLSASVAESLPGCSECAFLPFCGSDPVFNVATQDDPVGHRPTNDFCTKHIGIFNHLFSLLKMNDHKMRKKHPNEIKYASLIN